MHFMYSYVIVHPFLSSSFFQFGYLSFILQRGKADGRTAVGMAHYLILLYMVNVTSCKKLVRSKHNTITSKTQLMLLAWTEFVVAVI